MFMRVNSKCAHQVRPPSVCDSEAFVGRGIAGDYRRCSNHQALTVPGGVGAPVGTAGRLGTDGTDGLPWRRCSMCYKTNIVTLRQTVRRGTDSNHVLRMGSMDEARGHTMSLKRDGRMR